MRLALIAPRLPPACDGVGDHADALARALTARGHDVLAIGAGECAPARGYALALAGAAWGPAAAARALDLLRAHRAEAVVLEYTPFLYGARSVVAPALAAAARAARLPVATFAHEAFYGPDHPAVGSAWKARALAARDRATFLASSRVLVAGEERARALARTLPALASRLRVVPLGANVEPRDGYGRAPAAPATVVAFGVVMPRRRLELAVDAVAQLHAAGIPVALEIVGRVYDDVYAAGLVRRAREAGAGESVTVRGELSPAALSHAFARAAAAVHLAAEGTVASSGSLLALLAHGLPVVTARTPHDDPLFAGAVHAVDPRADALAAALRPLVREPGAAAALGAAAAARYRTAFGWERAADGVLAAFAPEEPYGRLVTA